MKMFVGFLIVFLISIFSSFCAGLFLYGKDIVMGTTFGLTSIGGFMCSAAFVVEGLRRADKKEKPEQ